MATFEEVSWDEVYDYIAGKFTHFKETYGPDSMAGISSSRCTNEENYLMQKFYPGGDTEPIILTVVPAYATLLLPWVCSVPSEPERLPIP